MQTGQAMPKPSPPVSVAAASYFCYRLFLLMLPRTAQVLCEKKRAGNCRGIRGKNIRERITQQVEIVYTHGLPHFPFERFCVRAKEYEQQEEKVCWKGWDALRDFAEKTEGESARIAGHIDADRAKKWLEWRFGKSLLLLLAMGGSFSAQKKATSLLRLAGYAKTTRKHFFLVGVVFSSPT